ncbi:MAG: 4-oxalomesaconate tautomerase [Gammaproteobacteria bacterium]|nr:4-oxalomesaconate tautomerase [Gammaproteobacteria bacterium]
MQTMIPCSVVRGGTSKGLFFLAADLPANHELRDKVLLVAMGSPDSRQIDGMGGAHPLSSKVAVVSASDRLDADVDYLFLQVAVDSAQVSDVQNCGNILAGVGPFAIEQGLIPAQNDSTKVRIHMVNSGAIAIARVCTPGGVVDYAGDARIDGVAGSAAPVVLEFVDIAGSNCGALLPTHNVLDRIDGVEVTCIDNGMPVVVMRASDFQKTGYESPDELEDDIELKARVENIRLQAGRLMNLGDVTCKTVPKMSLVAPARKGGVVCTRTFIPHRVHEAIGVLGAVSVATACVLPGSVAQQVCGSVFKTGETRMDVEHPGGLFTVQVDITGDTDEVQVQGAGLLRTARLLMQGSIMIPDTVWSGP